jgi:peptidoglycan/LPS O-acetylase OafA/YrhL
MRSIRFTNPAPLVAGSRLVVLDQLKGYALLLVLIYHLGAIFGWPNRLHGEVGVDLFLVVSGFTLTLGAAQLPWRQFLYRRIVRIFPAYWAALALFAFLQAWVFKVAVTPTSLGLHAVGLHAFAPPAYFAEINDSFWFISLILGLYVIFLVLRKHFDDVAVVIGTGALVTTAAALIYLGFDHTGGLIQLAVRIPSFFVGIVAALLLARPEVTIGVSAPLCLGLAGLLMLGWTKGIIPYYAFAAVVMIVLFLFATRKASHLPEVRFALRGLAFLGVYSYEIFLFHQPLIRDYNRIAIERLRGGATPTTFELAIGVVVALAVTLLLSVAVHKLTVRLFALARPPAPPAEATVTPIRFA